MERRRNLGDVWGQKRCGGRWASRYLALALASVACKAMPGPAYPDSLGAGLYKWSGSTTPRTAHAYCAEVEGAARSQAKGYNALGWLLTGLATASGLTPTIVSATSGDQLSDTEKGFNIALPVLATLAAAGALGAFTRESHDNGVAKEASLAMLREGTQAIDVCVSAVADWNGERGEASEAVRTRIATTAKSETAASDEASTLTAIPASRRQEVAARLSALEAKARPLTAKPQAREAVEKLLALLQLPTPNLQQLAQYTRIIQDSDPVLALDGKALEDLLVNILALQPLPPPAAPAGGG